MVRSMKTKDYIGFLGFFYTRMFSAQFKTFRVGNSTPISSYMSQFSLSELQVAEDTRIFWNLSGGLG
jgi:hypothetical protein